MAEVTLPGVGPVKKQALLLGGGAAVIVMAVLWWRKRNAAAAATPGVDPNAIDPNAIDNSGMAGGGGALTGPTPSAVTTPTSNPQWTQLVMQQLSFEDPSTLGKALGLYLTGSAVTPDQERLVDEAIAAEGYPPVSGPSGYPPAIRTQPAGGQTPPPAPAPKASTNDQWRRDALAWFGRQPKFAGTTPVLAQIAINDYLAGKRIRGTWEEWTVQTVITGTNQLGQHFEAGIGYPPDPPNTPF